MMLASSPDFAHDVSDLVEKALRALSRIGDVSPPSVLFNARELVSRVEEQVPSTTDNASAADDISRAVITAIDELPAGQAQAAEALFGLRPSLKESRIGARREQASAALGVSPGTFRNHHEPKLINLVAQRVAFALASPPRDSLPSIAQATSESEVLVLSTEGSLGALEVCKQLCSLGLNPTSLDQTLERSGYTTPSLIEGLTLSFSLAQAIVVVLESQLTGDATSLALTAGVALGLAADRTVVIQLGEANVPQALGGINVLHLRNALESRAALASALSRAGCRVSIQGDNASPTMHAAGWYRWTPTNAADPEHSEIADAVSSFESLDNDAGWDAARWLREEALASHPSTVTSLLLGGGQVLGFVAMRFAVIEFVDGKRWSALKKPHNERRPAAEIQLIARNRNAGPGTGKLLFEYALGEALAAAKHTGLVAILIEPPNDQLARLFIDDWLFRPLEKPSHRLYFPVADPEILAETAGSLKPE